MVDIQCKRIYEDASNEDGIRILVDRLWPRGITKEKAKLDHWLKEVAPSNELRKWYHHDGSKFAEFQQKYRDELQQGEQQEALEKLKEIVHRNKGTVTLLYGAKDEENNQAVILKNIIEPRVNTNKQKSK
jgi:uncharacterized protein YeaO (DUF488 family)